MGSVGVWGVLRAWCVVCVGVSKWCQNVVCVAKAVRHRGIEPDLILGRDES